MNDAGADLEPCSGGTVTEGRLARTAVGLTGPA